VAIIASSAAPVAFRRQRNAPNCRALAADAVRAQV
jgi:hypothetical protein